MVTTIAGELKTLGLPFSVDSSGRGLLSMVWFSAVGHQTKTARDGEMQQRFGS